MKDLKLAIDMLMDEEAAEVLDAAGIESMTVEAKALPPHLTVLCGGQMRKEVTKLNAYEVAAIEPSKAEESAKYVYAW